MGNCELAAMGEASARRGRSRGRHGAGEKWRGRRLAARHGGEHDSLLLLEFLGAVDREQGGQGEEPKLAGGWRPWLLADKGRAGAPACSKELLLLRARSREGAMRERKREKREWRLGG